MTSRPLGAPPTSLAPADVLALQRTIGNRATTAVLQSQSEPGSRPAGVLRQPEQAEAGAGVSPAREAFDAAVAESGIPVAAIMGLIGRAGAAMNRIIENPIAFANALASAVREGFQRFALNLGGHLASGLGGLLGGLAGRLGIPIPRDFGPAGIVSFAMNLLGIGADAIRERVSGMFGFFDFGFFGRAWSAISSLLGGGIENLLQSAVENLGGLANLVMDQVRSWLTNDLVQVALSRLIALLNPVPSIVEAISSIYRTMTFLRTKASAVAGLVESVMGAMADLVGGNIARAASAVEAALARSLPAAISFLADLIGIEDLPGRIREVLQRIREPIERGIDGVVRRVLRGVRGIGGGEEEQEYAPPAGE